MSFRNQKITLSILDFNNQVWRSFHATDKQNMKNDDGINVGCIIALFKIIKTAIAKAKENSNDFRIVICEDRYPTRKKDLYKKYQEAFFEYDKTIIYKDRPKKDLPYNPVEICREFIDCLPHIKIFAEGEEADDVICSFIHKYQKLNTLLFSTDQDLWQMIAKYPNLEIFENDIDKPNLDKLEKNFMCRDFNKVVLYKVIKGDSGDTVKSVHRFPFKKNLQAFLDCDGTVKDYFKFIKERCGENSKEYKKLMDNKLLIRLNYEVVRLRNDIKFNKQVFTKIDIKKWKRLCAVYQIPSLINYPLGKLFY